ncbi:HNH endonuclease [Aquabacterium sp. J223]|uniref:HNH endonuclease n=1 Tax=Aquabacterium sp. J223 TaxID=2898431 RepID=UPI0021AD50EA|nr:HNH endonuclease [Aquabacterium sp. J223]UUX95124.1 HNH endonuclease [Aquabacterium sp. J223]
MVIKRRLRAASGGAGPPPVEVAAPLTCPLCDRPVEPGPAADEHHLVPRSRGGREKVLVHRICHRKVHATFSERELARDFHTWAALRAHPEIATFVRWVRNKPPGYLDRTRRPRR